jgi:hypothetical protein
MVMRSILGICALALALVTPAQARIEKQLHGGKVLKFQTKSTGKSFADVKFIKDLDVLTFADPRCIKAVCDPNDTDPNCHTPRNVSSIEIRYSSGSVTQEIGPIVLPCEKWKFASTRFVYKDKPDDADGTVGGVTAVSLKSRSLAVKFKGSDWGGITGPLDWIEVRLDVFGDKTYCGRFDDSTFLPGKNLAALMSSGGPSGDCDPLPTPTPTQTNTHTFTPTETPTQTPTRTRTFTPTQTSTRTPTRTFTQTPTRTPTQTPTQTPTLTFTITPTRTPTRTFTPTNTPVNGTACDDGLWCNGTDTILNGECTVHVGDPCQQCEDAILININGDAYNAVDLDFAGSYDADDGAGGICGVSGGGENTAVGNIARTVDDSLFLNEMFGSTVNCAVGSGLRPGVYTVDLLFAELAYGTGCQLGSGGVGSRRFDVSLEGNLVLDNFDIFAEAGCALHPTGRPLRKTFPVDVLDGTLSISMQGTGPGDFATIAAVRLQQGPHACDCADTCDEDNDTCFLPSGTACDSHETCSNSACDGSGNCDFDGFNTAPCNDGIFCNGADTCSLGDCAGHAGDPCPGVQSTSGNCADSCNESTGSCTLNDPNGSACSDGSYCNGTETCTGGVCTNSTGDPCPGVQPTSSNCADSCHEASDTCTAFDPNGSTCSTGLFCDGTESCTSGTCGGSTGNPCPGPDGDNNCAESCSESSDNCSANDANGAACNDNVFCNGTDTCSSGLCSGHTGDPCVECQDGDGTCNECCNEASDNCALPDPMGSTCNDSNFGTILDQCNGAGACTAQTAPNITITVPPHGTFTTSSSTAGAGFANAGTVTNPQSTESITTTPTSSVTHNSPFNTFTFGSITLNTSPTVLNPILATLSVPNALGPGVPFIDKARNMVVRGGSVLDTAMAPETTALRINDTGLDKIESFIVTQLDLDPDDLIDTPLLIADNICLLEQAICFGCCDEADVWLDTFTFNTNGIAINVDSLIDEIRATITIPNLSATAHTDGVSTGDCDVSVSATSATVTDDYILKAQPANIPSKMIEVGDMDVDEQLPSNPIIGLNGKNIIADCGGLTSLFEGLVEDEIDSQLTSGLQDFLKDPDGVADGNDDDAPIAGFVQIALAEVSIAGPIGEGLGVKLEAPLFDVLEDNVGITLDSNSRVSVDPNNPPTILGPSLSRSFSPVEPFPTNWGQNMPGGGSYDIALGVAATMFNQLLRQQIENGLLTTDLTSLSLDPNMPGSPITAGLLSILVPEFFQFPSSTPMAIKIRPTMAPFVTGGTGPTGELADLLIPHLLVDIVTDYNTPQETVWLRIALDARAGFDLVIELNTPSPTDDVIVPTFALPLAENITAVALENPLGTDEMQLSQTLAIVFGPLVGGLGDSFGGIPLPSLLGLQVSGVGVTKQSQFMAVYLNLVTP